MTIVSGNGSRVPYQEAARSLLRDSVLVAMRDLLTVRDWAKITLGDISARAGVSRQTLYNEFGSRTGLAQAYALRLADQLVDHVGGALEANVGDVRAAFRDGLANFIHDSAADPLVRSLVGGEAKLDLLRLVTLDAGPLIDHATGRLTNVFVTSWVNCAVADADLLSHALVRLAVSYISTPSTAPRDAPEELSRLLTPYVLAMIGEFRPATIPE